MNHNKNVVVFTLAATLLLFAGSVCAYVFKVDYFKNINLVADVMRTQQDPAKTIAITDRKTGAGNATGSTPTTLAFDQYTLQKTIVDFRTDTTVPTLPLFMQKLLSLKKGEKKVVRIAWLGDSLIEGDLLTQTFRKQMQQMFGGYGVGFVPAQSVTAQFRTTVKHSWTGDWQEENFKSKTFTAPVFLSGHTFFTDNGTITMNDATARDSMAMLNKYLVCGPSEGKFSIEVNGQSKEFEAKNVINRLLLDSSNRSSVSVKLNNKKLPVYGLALEPSKGVVVDNFSFRGITGVELGKMDTTLLQKLTGNDEDGYDLVVMEYGANLMFRPDDKDYSWYARNMEAVVEKLRKAMPKTEFLIISTSDRAFRYGDTWQSAVGIDSLVKTQAKLAYDNDVAFYNMFASMGGANTIVNWASASPSLANKDYIHPNQRGAEVLGHLVYDAFLKEYRKTKDTAGIANNKHN